MYYFVISNGFCCRVGMKKRQNTSAKPTTLHDPWAIWSRLTRIVCSMALPWRTGCWEGSENMWCLVTDPPWNDSYSGRTTGPTSSRNPSLNLVSEEQLTILKISIHLRLANQHFFGHFLWVCLSSCPSPVSHECW